MTKDQKTCEHVWQVVTTRPAPGPCVRITVHEQRWCLRCFVTEVRTWDEQYGRVLLSEATS